eukprot:1553711-Heterocapsa_arctica.AAC.1
MTTCCPLTRSIPRQAPPYKPAGLERCDAATIQRWIEAGFNFPPYTFAERYCVRMNDSDTLTV